MLGSEPGAGLWTRTGGKEGQSIFPKAKTEEQPFSRTICLSILLSGEEQSEGAADVSKIKSEKELRAALKKSMLMVQAAKKKAERCEAEAEKYYDQYTSEADALRREKAKRETLESRVQVLREMNPRDEDAVAADEVDDTDAVFEKKIEIETLQRTARKAQLSISGQQKEIKELRRLYEHARGRVETLEAEMSSMIGSDAINGSGKGAAAHLRALKDAERELNAERAKRRRAEATAARAMKGRRAETIEVEDAKESLRVVEDALQDKWQQANLATRKADEQTSEAQHLSKEALERMYVKDLGELQIRPLPLSLAILFVPLSLSFTHDFCRLTRPLFFFLCDWQPRQICGRTASCKP